MKNLQVQWNAVLKLVNFLAKILTSDLPKSIQQLCVFWYTPQKQENLTALIKDTTMTTSNKMISWGTLSNIILTSQQRRLIWIYPSLTAMRLKLSWLQMLQYVRLTNIWKESKDMQRNWKLLDFKQIKIKAQLQCLNQTLMILHLELTNNSEQAESRISYSMRYRKISQLTLSTCKKCLRKSHSSHTSNSSAPRRTSSQRGIEPSTAIERPI